METQAPCQSIRIKNIHTWTSYPVVKNPPANAGGHRFDPWSGKIPHALGQLSPCITTTEAHVCRAHKPQQGTPPQWEACIPQLESRPCSKEPGAAGTQQQRPSATKSSNISFLLKKLFIFKKMKEEYQKENWFSGQNDVIDFYFSCA